MMDHARLTHSYLFGYELLETSSRMTEKVTQYGS